MPRPRPTRAGPAVVPALVVALVCGVIAAVALPPSASAPPAVAELSPRAVEVEERDEAALAGGDVGGVPTAGSELPATSTTMPAPVTASATTVTSAPTSEPVVRRRCVPNGDGTARQTEDPQSPPCTAVSEFDATTNGGATSKGVTADTVTIAVTASTPNVDDRMLAALEAHFNDRYEFHGRRLDLVKNTDLFYSNSPTVRDIVAEAVRADEEIGAFAATGLVVTGPGDDIFYDELARRSLVGVSMLGGEATTAELAAAYPYRFSLQPGFDRRIATEAEWLCAAWSGEAARFAGGAASALDRRVGLVYARSADGSDPDLSPLTDRLAACGLAPAVSIAVPWNDSFGSVGGYGPTSDTSTAVTQLRAAGVTTVVTQTNMLTELALWSTASTVGFRPEWVFGAYNYPNSSRIWVHPAKDQHERTFLLVPGNRILGAADSPMFQVMRQADPDIDMTYTVELYQAVLVIASGIQHAGPNLTPESFAAALTSLAWSNTGTGAPLHQASVGFGPGDPTWFDDVAVSWWDATEPAPEDGTPGALCYLDGGRRFGPQDFPDDTDSLRIGC